jgi:hypothetical protein
MKETATDWFHFEVIWIHHNNNKMMRTKTMEDEVRMGSVSIYREIKLKQGDEVILANIYLSHIISISKMHCSIVVEMNTVQ